MYYGTTVIWVQIKFNSWYTTFATFIRFVKEVLVILHQHIMLIWRLIEQENTKMLSSGTRKTKAPVKWERKI